MTTSFPSRRRRGLILARISRDHSDQGLGVQRQLARVARRFQEEGIDYDSDESLVDNSVSSFRSNRASFEGALEAIRSGRYEYIGVVAFDRLSRNTTEVINELIPAMWDSQAKVMTADGQTFDCRDGVQQVALKQTALRGEAERAEMGRRSTEFHDVLADEGRPSGQAPFGYRSVEVDGRRTWAIVESEAELIRSAVKHLLDGGSFHSVLQDWWDRGIKTRRAGKPHSEWSGIDGEQSGEWRSGTLRRFLLNPALAGLRRHRRYRRHPITGKVEWTGEETLVPAIWPPIISVEDHDALVALLDGRKEPHAQRSLVASIPSTVLRCGICGGPMTTGSDKRYGSRRYYSCKLGNARESCGRLQIAAEPLERVVAGHVVSVVQGTRSAFPSPDGSREGELERQLAQVSMQLEQVGERYLEGDVPRASFDRVRARLEEQQAAWQHELNALRASDTRASYVRQLQADGFDLDEWDALSVEERRYVVSQTIRRIQVAPASKPYWSADPDRMEQLVDQRLTIEFTG